jgi:hypothetical protein
MSMKPAALALVAAAVLPVGCGSQSSPETAAQHVTLGWHDKGRSLSIARGSIVVLKLDSVYWRVQGSSDRDVVSPTGQIEQKPAPSGTCVAGGGCGTTTARFRAVGAGTAHLRAARSSCGEVLRCTGGRGRYDVTIRVS